MSPTSTPEPRPPDTLQRAIRSPFPRLRGLLEGTPPGAPPIDLTVGEPRHDPPPFLIEELQRHAALFGRYPPIEGILALRGSIAQWIERRYGLVGAIDPDRNVLALSGSREGLFSAMFPALDRRSFSGRPAALIPNPFYQAYLAAALAAGAEPVMLDCPAGTGFLPDLDWLEGQHALLARTAVLTLCSPANPQGSVASECYLRRAIELARSHDFMLFADECYSEVYADRPPEGALAVASRHGGSLTNVVAFNSLSKRSNLPGLRSGFIAGDAAFLDRLSRFRNVAGPQMPLPVQWASARIWADEAHVDVSRARYVTKFDAAARILGNRFGNPRPAGGFFLWLEMNQFGGGEAAALTLWQRRGVKVLPGAYLTHASGHGTDPGESYIRVALVDSEAATVEALERIVSVAV